MGGPLMCWLRLGLVEVIAVEGVALVLTRGSIVDFPKVREPAGSTKWTRNFLTAFGIYSFDDLKSTTTIDLKLYMKYMAFPDMADGSMTPSASAVSADLEAQLKDYLNLLDEYQTLRQGLSAACAKGFLSLAQANFSSPNRIRHGQDFYDDRMQASTKVAFISSVGKFAVSSQTDTSGEKGSKDPLRWYGLLVPPALRQSQASFGQVVKDLVPRLLNVTKELEVLGAKIEETRALRENVK